MIDPELAERFKKRYPDVLHQRLLDHALDWDKTFHYTPEGWSERSCTAYRMAMEYALLTLMGEDEIQEDDDE